MLITPRFMRNGFILSGYRQDELAVELHSGHYRGRVIKSEWHQLRITSLETIIDRNGEIK